MLREKFVNVKLTLDKRSLHNSEDNIWETNIFGKSIGQIVDEGIMTKINNLTEETQSRMQGTIEKITNDQSRGVICIVL